MSYRKDMTNEDINDQRRGRRPSRDENPIDGSFKVTKKTNPKKTKRNKLQNHGQTNPSRTHGTRKTMK